MLELTKHSSNAFLMLAMQRNVSLFALRDKMDSSHQIKQWGKCILNFCKELLLSTRPCKTDLSVWLFRLLCMPSFQLFSAWGNIFSLKLFILNTYTYICNAHICVCVIWMGCYKILALFKKAELSLFKNIDYYTDLFYNYL